MLFVQHDEFNAYSGGGDAVGFLCSMPVDGCVGWAVILSAERQTARTVTVERVREYAQWD
jgi:hypothetical protein